MMVTFMLAVGAVGTFVVGLIIGSKRSLDETEKLDGRNRDLQRDLEKLSNHVLWMTGDKSLGGEIDMRQIPDRLPEAAPALPPARDEMDRLLDILESREVTKVTQLKGHNVGILHFGGSLCLRDAVDGCVSTWRPDIMMDDILMPKLTDAQTERARRMFRTKMAQAAIMVAQQPVPQWHRILGR